MSLASGRIRDGDRDAVNKDTLQYRLASGQPSFAITADGLLEVVGGLDYEKVTSHSLMVTIDNIGTIELIGPL